MIVQHFDVHTPKTQPPEGEGWEQMWYGYYRMTKCWSEQARVAEKNQQTLAHAKGELDERTFERDCFLSVLTDIQKESINMFELGAGWGEWCLALAGVINHNIIPVMPTSYKCLAVEAEPTHYNWIKGHFASQNINGITIHAAVSHKNGKCHFYIDAAADTCYGQIITFHKFNIPEMLRDIRDYILRRTIKVPMYTVDHLIRAYGFEHVDIIDMDVQGAEYEVLQGAAKSIKDDLIDYLKIGTHDRKLNDKLKWLLSPKFDLIVDIYPNSVGKVDGFPPIRCQDGIQLYKRKNINII